jgi:Zn-dependent oligopeptidase
MYVYADGATKYEVTLSYPHVVPILKLCAVPSTRATVEKAFNSRATPQNTEVLENIVQLRRQVAFVLGYPNYAAYVLEERMAESPVKVASFLDELAAGLRPLAVGDLASLAQLKAAEEGPDSGPILMSDYRYYMEQELRTKYSIDHDAIKEYFPLNVVVPNMLAMYQQMLSLKFTQVEVKLSIIL